MQKRAAPYETNPRRGAGGAWLRTAILALCLAPLTFAAGQPLPAEAPAAPTVLEQDEAALRRLVADFFAAYARKDLDAFLALFSEQSPDLPSRRQETPRLFAAQEVIRARQLAVRRLVVAGTKATVRVAVEMGAVDQQTGKPLPHFIKKNRTFRCVREDSDWKVWQETRAEDRLAETLLAARTEAERAALLAADPDLATSDLAQALLEQGQRRSTAADQPAASAAYELARQVAEQIGDRPKQAGALRRSGHLYRDRGEYARALACYRQSLALSDAAGDELEQAHSLASIAEIYDQQANYPRAAEGFRKAIAAYEAANRPAGIAQSLNGLGWVYIRQNDEGRALECFQRSLRLSRDARDDRMSARAMEQIACLYVRQHRGREALAWFQQSLSLYERAGSQAGVASALYYMGSLYHEQGNYGEALPLYQRSLLLQEELGNRAVTAGILARMAAAHQACGKAIPARELAARAVARAAEGGSVRDRESASALAGDILRRLGQPLQARAAFEQAVAIAETQRSWVAGSEEERARFFADRLLPYTGLVELLVAENRPDEALGWAERARARVLLDVWQRGRAGSLTTRAPDGSAPETALRSPALPVPPLSRAETGALLPAGDGALLEFVVAEACTYLFVLTRENERAGASSDQAFTLTVYLLPVGRQDLAGRIARFRDRLARRDARIRASARELYELLLKPAGEQLRGKSTFVVVPDGALWELPFQALETPTGRYLIEEAAVLYAPSLTLRREMARLRHPLRAPVNAATHGMLPRTPRPPASTLLAVGSPPPARQAATASRGSPTGLTDAEREVRTIARLYGAGESQVYVGVRAGEGAVRAAAGRFRVIHFATHGVLDNENPLRSHLLLARSPGAPDAEEGDGRLEAREMARLHLRAELVVLSACETMRGRFNPGEGVLGMTWAVFLAGCPTIVASQWKVSSAATAELMIEFHRQLQLEGQRRATGAEALRQAQLKLLRGKQYPHPFYWAAFSMIGDGG